MKDEKSKTNWTGVILYGFAGLMLALAILVLISLIGAASALPANQIFFQMFGLGELANLIIRPLQSLLINGGIILFLLMTAIAVLLFFVGQLLARQTGLSARVSELEAQIHSITYPSQKP